MKIAMTVNNTPHNLRKFGLLEALIAHFEAGLTGVPEALDGIVVAHIIEIRGERRLIINEA